MLWKPYVTHTLWAWGTYFVDYPSIQGRPARILNSGFQSCEQKLRFKLRKRRKDFFNKQRRWTCIFLTVQTVCTNEMPKLGFHPVVEKHYFSIPQMPDVTTKLTPKLLMDMAFLM